MVRWGDELLDAAEGGVDLDIAVAGLARPENQLAIVDSRGRVAVHTGSACAGYAGHATGNGVSAQANLAALPDAWDQMLAAYNDAAGPLAERLVTALASTRDGYASSAPMTSSWPPAGCTPSSTGSRPGHTGERESDLTMTPGTAMARPQVRCT